MAVCGKWLEVEQKAWDHGKDRHLNDDRHSPWGGSFTRLREDRKTLG